MPVDIKKGKRTATFTCDSCETAQLAMHFKGGFGYPAAPELFACEQAAEKHGWAYSIGFWSMLQGHQVVCPDCIKKHNIKVSKDGML